MKTNNSFLLSFPEEQAWKETTTYTFEGPSDSGVQHNLVLVILDDMPKNVTLEAYARSQCAVATRLLSGFEYIEDKNNRLPSGLPVFEIIYKYIPVEGVTLFQKQWYVPINDKVYLFTSTFNKKTLCTIARDVDKIVASLRVTETE